MSGIAPKQNALKFKIAPHKQTFIVKKISRKMGPLANGALWLSTPKRNDKSGTAAISRREQVTIDELMMIIMSALYKTNTLSLIFIVHM